MWSGQCLHNRPNRGRMLQVPTLLSDCRKSSLKALRPDILNNMVFSLDSADFAWAVNM